MNPTAKGSIRLFQLSGITVFLHWTWFIVAVYEFGEAGGRYDSRVWNVIEYVALFAIVLMHEFGHAFACRQVGGQANQIVLWPFGGVAYVNPPQRPGATLWSIVAGPLVNVVWFVLLTVLGFSLEGVFAFGKDTTDPRMFLRCIWGINLGLLIFNLLPIYPLDGGQILRSVLWFGLGRAKSLLVATVLGFVGIVGLMALSAWSQSIWAVLLCTFILLNCWQGFQAARLLLKFERLPRHVGFSCPACHEAPPAGAYWVCGRCRTAFDMFESRASCPKCAAQFQTVRCINCGVDRPFVEWSGFSTTITNYG